MDLEVGAHCAVTACNQLDFLPIECPGCSLSFCAEHARPRDHSCAHAERLERGQVVPTCPVCRAMVDARTFGGSADAAVDAHLSSGCARFVLARNESAAGNSAKHRCELRGCGGSEFQRIECSRCGRNFCLEHRFPQDHQCAAAGSSGKGNGNGKEKGKGKGKGKEKGKGSAAPGAGGAGGDKARAKRKKKLLRTKVILKQEAVGAGKVPEECRLSLPVYFPSDTDTPPAHVCFHKDWTVGKAIDVAAGVGRVRNTNNSGVQSGERLRLFSLKTRQPLDTSQKLQSLVPVLLSREGVVLERGDELKDDYVTKKDTDSGCAVQ